MDGLPHVLPPELWRELQRFLFWPHFHIELRYFLKEYFTVYVERAGLLPVRTYFDIDKKDIAELTDAEVTTFWVMADLVWYGVEPDRFATLDRISAGHHRISYAVETDVVEGVVSDRVTACLRLSGAYIAACRKKDWCYLTIIVTVHDTAVWSWYFTPQEYGAVQGLLRELKRMAQLPARAKVFNPPPKMALGYSKERGGRTIMPPAFQEEILLHTSGMGLRILTCDEDRELLIHFGKIYVAQISLKGITAMKWQVKTQFWKIIGRGERPRSCAAIKLGGGFQMAAFGTPDKDGTSYVLSVSSGRGDVFSLGMAQQKDAETVLELIIK